MLLNFKGVKCLQCKNPTSNIISVHTGKEYGRGDWIFRLFPALFNLCILLVSCFLWFAPGGLWRMVGERSPR